MVQTLSGSWWLWLVPMFLICLFVMIPMSLSELGMNKKNKKQEDEPAAEPAKTDEDDITEVLILAAAAYVSGEPGRGGSKMRNLKITVNGKTYDVSVEEEGRSYTPRYSTIGSAPAAAPARTVSAPAAPAPAPVPVAAPAHAPAPTGTNLEAPLSGRVVSIVAPVGTAVKKGDTVVVLEAMKLQSEICAENDGIVTRVLVEEKQDVTTGDVLAVIS